MAFDDILFQDGDLQNFIEEILPGSLNAPLDILSDHYARTVQELPPGSLNEPLDMLLGSMTANEVLFYELRLAGETSYAFVQ